MTGITDHQGNALAWNATPPRERPPAEIGPVQSMDVTPQRRSWGCAAAMLLVVLWTGTAFPIAIVASSLGVSPNGGWGLLGGVGISVVVVGTALVLQRRWGTTYVGERGVARTRSGAVGGRAEVLRFDQAAHLYVGRTADRLRNAELLGAFSKGAMIGWTYAYSWEDSRGRALMNLTGHLPDDRRPTRRGHPYHFTRAAEAAWSRHRIGRVRAGVDRLPLEFPVSGFGAIRLAARVVEFVVDGQTDRIDRAQFTGASLTDDRVAFTFGVDRRFVCPSGRIANLVVFVWALNEIVGVDVR